MTLHSYFQARKNDGSAVLFYLEVDDDDDNLGCLNMQQQQPTLVFVEVRTTRPRSIY
jgi:hypothetical protein